MPFHELVEDELATRAVAIQTPPVEDIVNSILGMGRRHRPKVTVTVRDPNTGGHQALRGYFDAMCATPKAPGHFNFEGWSNVPSPLGSRGRDLARVRLEGFHFEKGRGNIYVISEPGARITCICTRRLEQHWRFCPNCGAQKPMIDS